MPHAPPGGVISVSCFLPLAGSDVILYWNRAAGAVSVRGKPALYCFSSLITHAAFLLALTSHSRGCFCAVSKAILFGGGGESACRLWPLQCRRPTSWSGKMPLSKNTPRVASLSRDNSDPGMSAKVRQLIGPSLLDCLFCAEIYVCASLVTARCMTSE